jgi:hypothetical protein
MPARRPDLARPWAKRGQRPCEPPPRRSSRAGSGHHGDAARRQHAHLAVDARAGEGARRGVALPPASTALSLARSGEKEGVGERKENELGLLVGGFVHPKRARSRPSRSDGRDRAAHHWAPFGPGGMGKWRPGPRFSCARGRESWPLTGRFALGCGARRSFFPAGPPRTKRPGGLDQQEGTVHRVSIFRVNFSIEFQ